MNSDVSIYVPAFNAENTIEECIKSILSQTIKPSKILIINDCSTDNTLKILSNFENEIEIINNKKNMGVSYSRNLAKKYLKTKFIASIDADVEIYPEWIELLVNKIGISDTIVADRQQQMRLRYRNAILEEERGTEIRKASTV